MRGNRRKDTAPEMAVRRLVHAAGLRYRVDARPLPALNRKADLVFTRAKVAVFVDGCLWHRCPIHYREPKSNVEYWRSKIARNAERDEETNQLLKAAGWVVVRGWEHETAADIAERVLCAVRKRT